MTGKYQDLSKGQLIQLLEKRDRTKKLGLVWERDEIERDKAVDADFVAVSMDAHLSDGAAPWRNLVIEGDNFDALRWLRMSYSGRVKCIYIDPPYNTGNKDWVYNDRYFDPNDRFRHSTWLEFLYQRLVLARDLLAEDGVLLCSINDEGRARLEMLMDEALPGMRMGSFVWRTKDTANDADRNFSSVHEHVLAYGKPEFSFLGYELSDSKYKNPDGDPRGRYSADPLTKAHSSSERENTFYPIQDPETGWWYPCSPDRVWAYASEKMVAKKKLRANTMEALIRDNRIIFPAKECVTYSSMSELLAAIRSGTGPVDGNGRQLLREDLPDLEFWIGKPIALGRPSKKAFWSEKKSKIKPVSSLILGRKEKKDPDLFELVSEKQGKATGEIQEIFGAKAFNYPKPSSLLRSLLQAVAGPGDLVLDFFAGSATTAQAVMELNREDDGGRQFIMVSSTEATKKEPRKNVCRDVTAERIRRLNASDTPAYADLNAEFAYLRLRRVPFEDLNYELQPEETWLALQAIHDLPLIRYDAHAAFNIHEKLGLVVVYADRYSSALIERVRDVAQKHRNVFLYTWAPGQVEPHLAGLDIQILSVREALVRRFQQ